MTEPNWQKKIEEIEAEIYDPSPSNNNSNNHKPSLNNIIITVREWFSTLPTVGKAIVGVFGIMLALSLLQTVFSLVKLLLGFVVLAGIVYFGYQFLNNNKNNS